MVVADNCTCMAFPQQATAALDADDALTGIANALDLDAVLSPRTSAAAVPRPRVNRGSAAAAAAASAAPMKRTGLSLSDYLKRARTKA